MLNNDQLVVMKSNLTQSSALGPDFEKQSHISIGTAHWLVKGIYCQTGSFSSIANYLI